MVSQNAAFFELVLQEAKNKVEYNTSSNNGSSNSIVNTNTNAKATYRENTTISMHHNLTTNTKLRQFHHPRGWNNGGGGLILFYHVAKTGGSTVRSFFEQVSQRNPSKFMYGRYLNYQKRNANANTTTTTNTCIPPGEDKNKMAMFLKECQNLLANENNTMTYLWEIHGGSPGLDILAPYISELRKTSQLHNKSFFAFTMVREPVSHAESYFKFFHVNCTDRWRGRRWCEHRQFHKATEQNILESAELIHPNQQCFLLKHASAIEGMNPSFYQKCKVTHEDCDNIYETMKGTLDWVGTMERLSMDTLPLLQYLVQIQGYNSNNVVVKNKNVAEKLPFALSNTTVAALRNATDLDHTMYDRVKSDYVLDELYPGINIHSFVGS